MTLGSNEAVPPSVSAQHVAAVLRRMIVGGELPDGVLLPRQEDLLAQFGVANPTLREAMSMLEAEGLVSIQSGQRGGAIVHSPDSTGAAFTMGLALERRHASLRDVREAIARVQFECSELCALASDRAERVVPVLRRLIDRAVRMIDEPSDVFARESLAFHDAIFELSDNHSLNLVASSLRLLWEEHAARFESSTKVPRFTKEHRRVDIEAHRAITDAIAEGDIVLVRRLQVGHSNAARDFWSLIEGPTLIDVTSEGLEALRAVAKPAPETW